MAGFLPLLAKTWPVEGIVIVVDPSARTILVSHGLIANRRETYIEARAMPFRVKSAGEPEGL